MNVIGRVIESYARRFGYGVVRDYTGHGVGSVVPYQADDPALRRAARDDRDGARHDLHHRADAHARRGRLVHVGRRWTVLTADGSWVAQWEHTLVVTDDGDRDPHPANAARGRLTPVRPTPTANPADGQPARSDTIASYTEICRIR